MTNVVSGVCRGEGMAKTRARSVVPASFFGIVLSLVGLGNAWRAAHRVWGLAAIVGELVMWSACAVWLLLVVLYASKWLSARDQAFAELHDPIQCCFVGLTGVSTMLVAAAVLPYSTRTAIVLFGAGAAITIGFAVWRTGSLWMGGRAPDTTTAVLYLPVVGGGFVLASVASSLGHVDWGQYAIGASSLSWLAIESVVLHRLYTAAPLAPALRPTIGIQLAPPTVGALAYLSVTTGPPGIVVHALVGYGILQALLLARLLPWVREQPFAPSYWAFGFGTTALATAPIRMIERGDTGLVVVLAPFLFAAANVVILLLVLGTVRMILQGRLVKPPSPVVGLPSRIAPHTERGGSV